MNYAHLVYGMQMASISQAWNADGVLHAYVMEHSKEKLAFTAKLDQDYFKGGCGALMLNIDFSSVFNLITLASLDVTFMRLWIL
jgi:hypothetical protein